MSAVTKEALRAIRADIDAALKPIREKHNLARLELGNCSFDPSGPFTFKLTGVAGGGKTKEALQYEAEAKYVFLPPLGAGFIYGGDTFIATGIRGTKVQMDSISEGKQYAAKIDAVSKAYRRANPEVAAKFDKALYGNATVEAPR